MLFMLVLRPPRRPGDGVQGVGGIVAIAGREVRNGMQQPPAGHKRSGRPRKMRKDDNVPFVRPPQRDLCPSTNFREDFWTTAREGFGQSQSVKILLILNPAGYMLKSSGFALFI